MKTLLRIAAVALIVAPSLCAAQGRTAGLLGKNYIRGSYLHLGVDDPVVERFDSSLKGFDVEVNLPLKFLSGNSVAADFYSDFDYNELEGRAGLNFLSADFRTSKLGVRLFSPNGSDIRPYIGLGMSLVRSRARLNGQTTTDREESFLTSMGVEIDLMEKLSARHDVDLPVKDLDFGSYEGTLIYWTTENLFLRGGVVVPFDSDLGVGGTIGGGLAF